MRVLSIGGREGFNACGWFNDPVELSLAAARYNQRNPEGVYITLNPLHPGCLARTNNKIVEGHRRGSTARDVIARRWLPIDIDPERPKGISSTEEELKLAMDHAGVIAERLTEEFGFPQGVKACSGNGAHLLYRVDMPADDNATQKIKLALSGATEVFRKAGLLIDNLHNADRIWKLYGTTARKGENTPERPHRASYVSSAPAEAFEDMPIVTIDRLDALAAFTDARPPTAAKRKRQKAPADIDLDKWIKQYGVSIRRKDRFDGSGVVYVLESCLFDPSHIGTSACIGKAPSGALFYKCQHNSCSEKTWADVKKLVEAAAGGGRLKEGVKGEPTAKSDMPTNPWDLARLFLSESFVDSDTGETTLLRYRQQFFVYSDRRRCYRAASDDAIRVRLIRWLGGALDSVTNRRVNDVLGCIEGVVTVPDDDELPFHVRLDLESASVQVDLKIRHWVSLHNGILDLDRFAAGEQPETCLMANTAEWFSASALDFNFPADPAARECPRWMRFLDEVFAGEQTTVDLLQEAFGYCFCPELRLERFFVFAGIGANGKSTALNILSEVLGPGNTMSLKPEQLADVHMLASLHGTLANICADVNELDRMEEGLIKAITSSDYVTARRLWKPPFQFRVTARLFFSANVLPRFSDNTLGVWRRMIVVPFDRVIEEDEIDVHLGEKLRAELPGIFLWAVQGMARLLKNHQFTNAPACNAAIADYKVACFPVLAFLEQCCYQQGQTTARELWLAYRRWGESIGLSKLKPQPTFLQDVQRLVRNLQIRRVHGRLEQQTEIYGISVKAGLDLTSPAVYGSPGPPPSAQSDSLWSRNGTET